MHGNKKDNPKLYHLYEIIDKETDGTFKYGISGDPISSQDNLSKRVRDQVSMGNLYVGWLRYYGRILLKRIIICLLPAFVANRDRPIPDAE